MKSSRESACLKTVRLPPKCQVVIPKNVRDQLKLRPGERLQIYFVDGAIRLERPSPVTEVEGIAKGMQ